MKKTWIVLLLLGLTACTTTNKKDQDPYTGQDPSKLPAFLSKDYQLVRFNGNPVTPGGAPLGLRFEPVAGKSDEFKISGRMCNTFFGQGQWNRYRQTLIAPQLASTRMFCEKDMLNQLDGTVGQMFQQEVKITSDGAALWLEGSSQVLEYTLVEK